MSERGERRYYRRKSKIVKMRRKIAWTRRRIRRLRMLLRVTLIFLILYFSYWILSLDNWYLDPTDIMNMNPDVVKIDGNVITPEYKISDIIRTTEIPYEQIFKLSTKQLEENLSRLQSVKRAYVRRFWLPARIIVFIEERVPVFLISPNEETQPIAAITLDGHYMDREYMPIPTKYKTTKVLSYGTDEDNYENWDTKTVDELLRLIKTIEAYSKQKAVYLDLRNKNDVYIKLEDVLLRLGTIDATTKDRIKWIPTILPETKTLKQNVKYVDLRWKNAYYIKLDSKENKTEVQNKEPEEE